MLRPHTAAGLAVGSALVLLVLLLPLSAAARSADGNLAASIAADGTIALEAGGAAVTHLDPGTYVIVVADHSSVQNFHLQGPHVDRETGQAFTGRVTWTVTLGAGSYVYFSDPFADQIHGTFTVGNAPSPTLFARVSSSSISLKNADGTRVSQLAPGTYAIAVEDTIGGVNFRLAGPGVNLHTQVQEPFSTTWDVTFRSGTYFYFSDRNPGALHGSFVVGAPSQPNHSSTLLGTVGPDIAIGLMNANFSPVTRLHTGKYTVVVADLSPDHDFRLLGAGIDKATSVPFVGTVRWHVTLRRGRYRFQCDPHQAIMNGRFVVVA